MISVGPTTERATKPNGKGAPQLTEYKRGLIELQDLGFHTNEQIES
jgi:hypothetical protein